MSRIALALAVMLAACGGGTSTTPETTATTTTTAAPTTTAPATTTTAPPTTTTVPPTALERLGYPVSDDWVVETVVADLDAGTGGLAIAEDGTMYLGDFGYPDHPGEAVWRILPDGSAEPWATSEDMGTLTMTTLGADGSLYQSSYGTDRVFRISPDGVPEVVAEDVKGPHRSGGHRGRNDLRGGIQSQPDPPDHPRR